MFQIIITQYYTLYKIKSGVRVHVISFEHYFSRLFNQWSSLESRNKYVQTSLTLKQISHLLINGLIISIIEISKMFETFYLIKQENNKFKNHYGNNFINTNQ